MRISFDHEYAIWNLCCSLECRVELIEFDRANQMNPAIGSSRAGLARPIKIFYLYRGRNAWHSTWVQHYYPGCMTDAISTAKSNAESMRGPGNVFYILDTPALAIESELGSLVITQINTGDPLGGYEPLPMASLVENGEFKRRRLPRRLKVGAPLAEIRETFQRGSPYWSVAPAMESDVLVLWLQTPRRPKPLDPGGLLVRRKSSSGGDRSVALEWAEQPLATINTGHVSGLAEIFHQERVRGLIAGRK